MASSAKDIQLRELKDTISQLNTMVSEQTELIKSLDVYKRQVKYMPPGAEIICRGDKSSDRYTTQRCFLSLF